MRARDRVIIIHVGRLLILSRQYRDRGQRIMEVSYRGRIYGSTLTIPPSPRQPQISHIVYTMPINHQRPTHRRGKDNRWLTLPNSTFESWILSNYSSKVNKIVADFCNCISHFVQISK